MRPPIDTGRAYTVLSRTEARKRLANEFGVPRHETARMTLDQLHDELAENVVSGMGADFVVLTDRTFARLDAHSTELLRRLHGDPVEAGAGISSRSAALKAFADAGVDIPEGEPVANLEDALSGLYGSRQLILEDDSFIEYGREMSAMIARHPSGRAA
jgi:hypothetical protein